jgi:hypothetical protein
VSFSEALKAADRFWHGAESDVTGFALPFVVAQAVWYCIVGVPSEGER